MKSELTTNTRVLMSFGAREGGFEFAMQLRSDIYAKYKKSPEQDPAYCYLDAESLRGDSETTYNYDRDYDKNMMQNPKWKENYLSAMESCKTMILLITELWLKSKWCKLEFDWLQQVCAKNQDLKTICVIWPDACSILKNKTGLVTMEQIDTMVKNGGWKYEVSGAPPIQGSIEGFQTNTFAYSCTTAEKDMILSNVNG